MIELPLPGSTATSPDLPLRQLLNLGSVLLVEVALNV